VRSLLIFFQQSHFQVSGSQRLVNYFRRYRDIFFGPDPVEILNLNYFRRYRDIFFGPDPVEILNLTPHKKSWVLQAMRHFGNYYNYKTNNPESKELIEKIINRYGLNIGSDMHQKIYIVDDLRAY
jgi:hypothetical protein